MSQYLMIEKITQNNGNIKWKRPTICDVSEWIDTPRTHSHFTIAQRIGSPGEYRIIDINTGVRRDYTIKRPPIPSLIIEESIIED